MSGAPIPELDLEVTQPELKPITSGGTSLAIFGAKQNIPTSKIERLGYDKLLKPALVTAVAVVGILAIGSAFKSALGRGSK